MADQALPILYSFRRCPYAMRARLAIFYSQIGVELREVELKNKPPCMIAYSSKATVPVLVLPDKKVIDESLDIILWALSHHDPNDWMGNSSQKEAALKLVEDNDTSFKYYLDRYKYADRYPEHSVLDYRIEAEKFIDRLERQLTRRQFLLGDNISFSDIAIFPFIRQFAFVDKHWFDRSQYQRVQEWLNYFLETPLFTEVMKKYSPWKLGDHLIQYPP